MIRMTILKTKEMASVLDINSRSLVRRTQLDKEFPRIQPNGKQGHYWFIKEKVLKYLKVKKSLDVIIGGNYESTLLDLSPSQLRPRL